ncbi:MAG TPA: autotransporter outer membrane beta-barrel domain-containing protein [Burkholderiales bacterium]|nr:autotransporter outer membrane beta-barrel domain-containing protein [Burkholderiales bacterium]
MSTRENTVLHKTLGRIVGCALLLYGSNALAFTLIGVTEEGLTPGNIVTDTFTLQAQVQPIVGTIRSQIFGLRRPGGSRQVTQAGGMMLAANDYSGSRSDVNWLAAAGDPSTGGGSGGGSGQSLWISTAYDSLENTFFRTAFYGATQNVLVGYDITRSDKYVLGISGGYEASNFVTSFNSGNEKTGGYNLNPYAAWLISDAWTLDLIAGYGKFKTDQTRLLGSSVDFSTIPVNSNFASKRSFASTNLSNISAWGDWKLTSSLGYQWSQRDQDAYTENGLSGAAVPELKQTSKQWNLLEEIAYGRGNSETFFGARYEAIRNYEKIEFTTGEQPANDPTSALLTAGWRYFGKGLTASFVFSGRVAQEQVKEHGFSMVLRIDL